MVGEAGLRSREIAAVEDTLHGRGRRGREIAVFVIGVGFLLAQDGGEEQDGEEEKEACGVEKVEDSFLLHGGTL